MCTVFLDYRQYFKTFLFSTALLFQHVVVSVITQKVKHKVLGTKAKIPYLHPNSTKFNY